MADTIEYDDADVSQKPVELEQVPHFDLDHRSDSPELLNPSPTPTGSIPASEPHPDRATVITNLTSEYEALTKLYASPIREFDFQLEPEHIIGKELAEIQAKVADLARKSRAVAALVLWESSREADVDGIVTSLQEGSDSAVRFIIFCRIVSQGEQQASEYLKLSSEMADACKKVRNLAIISCAVKTPELAEGALKKIIKATKRCWRSEGLKNLGKYLSLNDTRKFGIWLYFSDDGMFKPDIPDDQKLFLLPECKQIIKDGLQLKSLDPSVQARLREEISFSMEAIKRIEGAQAYGDLTDVIPVYKINHLERRCQALIINNVDFDEYERRHGSDADVTNLGHALKLLQYEVTEKRNLKARKIRKAVTEFAQTTEHGDACILVIMSHGSLNYICGTDASRERLGDGVVSLQDLLDSLSFGGKVKGKPRLVLFQACRDKDVPAKETNGEQTCTTAIRVGKHYGSQPMSVLPSPNQCGLIVGYATSANEKSFRNYKGSRFILAVCATFYEFAHKEDMVAMITRINNIMTHEFDYPKDEHGKIFPMQLPSWTVQTDKMFFLVDTSTLCSSQSSQSEPAASVEVDIDEGNSEQ